jgi:hypothetical protein
MPPALRRVNLRIRLERNVLVLLEIGGAIDIETDIESQMRKAALEKGHTKAQAQSLRKEDAGPNDGVIDFKLTVAYDTSTHLLSEIITIGADPSDRDVFRKIRP